MALGPSRGRRTAPWHFHRSASIQPDNRWASVDHHDFGVPTDVRLAPFKSSDDERIGRLLVLLRHRAGLTQRALAASAGVPRQDVLRVEAGLAGSLPLDRLRRTFEAVGGRARLGVWWNGAAADRLLDERHAGLVERAVAVLDRRGWTTLIEASFSEYGERGSIDILGARQAELAVAICEIKSDFGSLEETNRIFDAKARLVPKIAADRFGWRPEVVGRILIVPSTDAVRRVITRHERTMASSYPARSHEVRAWLRKPTTPLRGIWFLSEVPNRDSVNAA